MFLDQVINGDISNTPSAKVNETMFESSRNNNKILTAVATELESCCEETKNKLDDLSKTITPSFRSLRVLITNKFDRLTELIRNEFTKLESNLASNFSSLESELVEQLKTLTEVVLESR